MDQSRNLNETNQDPKTYVDSIYSYAYGQLNEPLVFKTLFKMLDETSSKVPDQLAIVSAHEDYKCTFRQFVLNVNCLASLFIDSFHIVSGNVVAIMTGNTYRSVLIQYACAKIGATVCMINAFYSRNELEFSLNKVNPKLFFVPGPESDQEKSINKIYSLVTSIADKLPKSLKYIVLLDGQKTGNLNKIGDAQVSMFVDLMGSNRMIKSHDQDKKLPLIHTFNDADSPALLLFTSGTTGPAKAAALSHHNIVNNIRYAGKGTSIGFGSIVCLPIPTFHVFGICFGPIMMAIRGCTLVLTGYRYDIESIVTAIQRFQCTHLVAVPAILMDLLEYMDNDKRIKVETLTNILTGATLVPDHVTRGLTELIPSLKSIDILYGATETGPLITTPKVNDAMIAKLDNVGVPMDGTEIKIIDHKTEDIVAIGETGELCTRGHNIFPGYWNDEVQTRNCINSSRWFKTGDLAKMDSNGYIRIVGRIKDLIIRGGMNISPKEIEDVLISNPLISFASVFGIPDMRLGEEICAWIKFRDESKQLTEEQIVKYCGEKIAYFKVPKKILFVKEFPTTATGKVIKGQMRETSIAIFSRSRHTDQQEKTV